MRDFKGVAEKIARILSETEQGIAPRDIPGLIGETIVPGSDKFNCYPGHPGSVCHEVAFFVSLKAPPYSKGYLSCRNALEKLVQHMQGKCVGKTKVAVIILNEWDKDAYEDYKWNIQQIGLNADLEFYLITGRTVSELGL